MRKYYLTTREAAQYMAERGVRFALGTLSVWRSEGRGPRFYRLRGRVFYRPGDLDLFIKTASGVDTVDSTKNCETKN